jgi:hypothetical protein
MSFFSFDRSGSGNGGNFWNYNKPEKEDYSPILMGRVVELSDPPKTKFQSQEIERWDDGNPKRNIRMTILDGAGNEFVWDFGPGGRNRPSNAMLACANALIAAGINGASGLEEMLGMTISIQTQEPPAGFSYGANAPRPWQVTIMDKNKGEHRGTKHIKDPVTEGAEMTAKPVVAQPQAPTPAAVQQAAQNAANAMGFQQPMMPQQQGYYAQQPQGGAAIYDDDIPFN